MSEVKLKKAKALIQQKRYDDARAILLTISNNPTAKSWLNKLEKRGASPPDDSSQRLQKARKYIQAENFDAARQILMPIASNPTAQRWLQKIDEMDDPFAIESVEKSSPIIPKPSKNYRGHIAKNLSGNEYLAFKTGVHWFTIITGILRNLLYFVLAFWGLAFLFADSGDIGTDIGTSMIFLCLPTTLLYSIASGLVKLSTSEFGVTSKKVIIKTGLVNVETFELNLGQIETFQLQNTLLGRIIGFKNIEITGSGGSTRTIKSVARANQFHKAVIELMG
jgi:hypothetical protein